MCAGSGGKLFCTQLYLVPCAPLVHLVRLVVRRLLTSKQIGYFSANVLLLGQYATCFAAMDLVLLVIAIPFLILVAPKLIRYVSTVYRDNKSKVLPPLSYPYKVTNSLSLPFLSDRPLPFTRFYRLSHCC